MAPRVSAITEAEERAPTPAELGGRHREAAEAPRGLPPAPEEPPPGTGRAPRDSQASSSQPPEPLHVKVANLEQLQESRDRHLTELSRELAAQRKLNQQLLARLQIVGDWVGAPPWVPEPLQQHAQDRPGADGSDGA
jgi:hypothetical protein